MPVFPPDEGSLSILKLPLQTGRKGHAAARLNLENDPSSLCAALLKARPVLPYGPVWNGKCAPLKMGQHRAFTPCTYGSCHRAVRKQRRERKLLSSGPWTELTGIFLCLHHREMVRFSSISLVAAMTRSAFFKSSRQKGRMLRLKRTSSCSRRSNSGINSFATAWTKNSKGEKAADLTVCDLPPTVTQSHPSISVKREITHNRSSGSSLAVRFPQSSLSLI